MFDFRRNFFFVKFVVLFFLITLFGYWGIDLNSEEVYIAFSFFFLVALAFVMLRLGVLAFFAGLVNRRYAYIVQEGIVAAYIVKAVGIFWRSPLRVIGFVARNYSFFVLTAVSLVVLRANLLVNFSVARFSFLRLMLGVAVSFFVVSVLRFCQHFVFSSLLSNVFVVKV